MRRALFTWSLASVLGAACAHRADDGPEATTTPPDTAAQLTRLRQENASLRTEVAHLRERLRLSTDAGPATAERPSHLPVVKLEPPADAQIETFEATRGGVSLAAVPHSGGWDETAAEIPEDLPIAPPAAAAPPEPAASDGVKSYRLVGSRLVDLTRKHRAAPERPRKGRAPTGVAAEYEAAMVVYRDGRHADAERMFSSIVARHPADEYADNALYWSGEAAYDQAHYADALAAFTEVVERYGGGNKAPDALLKIGLCYGKLGDVANARDVLTQLIAAYPSAQATRLAQAKLTEL
jgi:tol-pal system protein YbgF